MNCATHSDTAAVAFCRTCGKPLCNQCTRDVRGVIYCESCLAARLEGTAPAAGFVPPEQTVYPPMGGAGAVPRPPVNAGPNPTVAGILGAIPLGLGAVYCGQYAKGLAHLGIVVLAIVGLSSDLPWQADHCAGNFSWLFLGVPDHRCHPYSQSHSDGRADSGSLRAGFDVWYGRENRDHEGSRRSRDPHRAGCALPGQHGYLTSACIASGRSF